MSVHSEHAGVAIAFLAIRQENRTYPSKQPTEEYTLRRVTTNCFSRAHTVPHGCLGQHACTAENWTTERDPIVQPLYPANYI